MYKEDLALNNLQRLICQKIQPNPLKMNQEGTQRDGPKSKKIDENVLGTILTDSMCQEKKENEGLDIALIQEFSDSKNIHKRSKKD